MIAGLFATATRYITWRKSAAITWILHSCGQIIWQWHFIPNWKCFSPFECYGGTYPLHADWDYEMGYYLKNWTRCHVSPCQEGGDKIFNIFVLLHIWDVLAKEKHSSDLHIYYTKNKDMITNSKLIFSAVVKHHCIH